MRRQTCLFVLALGTALAVVSCAGGGGGGGTGVNGSTNGGTTTGGTNGGTTTGGTNGSSGAVNALTIGVTGNTIVVGQSVKATVTAADVFGKPISPLPANLQYTSSNTVAATISSDGTILGNAVGVTTISVRDPKSGKSGSANVVVATGLGNGQVNIN